MDRRCKQSRRESVSAWGQFRVPGRDVTGRSLVLSEFREEICGRRAKSYSTGQSASASLTRGSPFTAVSIFADSFKITDSSLTYISALDKLLHCFHDAVSARRLSSCSLLRDCFDLQEATFCHQIYCPSNLPSITWLNITRTQGTGAWRGLSTGSSCHLRSVTEAEQSSQQGELRSTKGKHHCALGRTTEDFVTPEFMSLVPI